MEKPPVATLAPDATLPPRSTVPPWGVVPPFEDPLVVLEEQPQNNGTPAKTATSADNCTDMCGLRPEYLSIIELFLSRSLTGGMCRRVIPPAQERIVSL